MRPRLRELALLPALLVLTIAVSGDPLPAMAQPAGSALASSTPAAPTIKSTGPNVYVNGVDTNFVGTPGQFTLSDPGSTVTGYYYSFTNGGLGTLVPAGSGGTVTLAITPFDESVLTLYAAAVNGPSPPSPQSSFEIQTHAISNIATLAWWKLNAGHGAVATDATGNLHDAALHKDASLDCATTAAPDGYKCSMSVGGHGGQARTAPAILPVIGNRTGFSVSIWVNLSKCSSSCVALSEDGLQTDEFALGYKRSCTAGSKTGPCWEFSRLLDQTGTIPVTASSAPGSAKLGKWTQLTGVFESVTGTVTLYVNGVQVQQVSGAVPAAELDVGRVRIGNVMPGGSAQDWHGRLSNACVFFNSLGSADVTTLFKGDSAHPHNGCAALFAKYP